MKLQTDDRGEVITSGTIGQLHLGIDSSNFDLAMEILMDLYQDPIGSIVRELSSNAVDAMQQAGRGHLPIEVTLPNTLSPYLVVRDRGNGMTEEFIALYYSKLLTSTKRDANDEIGGYGIGSKSPLGYTDSYTLSTRVGGQELHVHVSRSGGFTLLGKNTTSEEDGTTVMVPVKDGDYQAFKDATSWLRYMSPPPLINGVAMEVEERLLEGGNWYITTEASAHDSQMCLLLGPIPYKLDIYQLGISSSSNQDSCMRQVAEASYMRVMFPIGSLSLTPSREGIRYDSQTVTTIKETLLGVFHQAMEAIEGLLATYKWKIDARAVSRKYGFYQWWRRVNKVDPYADSRDIPQGETWYLYSYSLGEVKREIQRSYPYGGAEVVYLNNNPPRSRMRVAAYVRANPTVKVLVGPIDSTVARDLFPIGLLSSIPDVPPTTMEVVSGEDSGVVTRKAATPRIQRGNMRALLWETNGSPDRTYLYIHTVDTVMELDGEGYYIPMSRGKVEHPYVKGELGWGEVEFLREVLGIQNQPLYVVPTASIQRLGEGWVDIIPAAHRDLTPYLIWIKHLYLAPRPLASTYGIERCGGGHLLEYTTLMAEVSKLMKIPSMVSRVQHLYRHYLGDLWAQVPTNEDDPLQELHNLILELYPLVNYHHLDLDSKGGQQYISLVDNTYCRYRGAGPVPIMSGRELMIHYYHDGGYGDVRGYYERWG